MPLCVRTYALQSTICQVVCGNRFDNLIDRELRTLVKPQVQQCYPYPNGICNSQIKSLDSIRLVSPCIFDDVGHGTPL